MTPKELLEVLRKKLRIVGFDMFDVEGDSVVVGQPADNGNSYLYKVTPLKRGLVEVREGMYIDDALGMVVGSCLCNGTMWRNAMPGLMSLEDWLAEQGA